MHRFVRLCRLAGLRISVSESVDAMRAASLAPVLAERTHLRNALEAALVKDRRDLPAFRRLFDAFFGLRPAFGAQGHGHGHGHEDLSDEGETEAFTMSDDVSKTPQQGHSHGKPVDIRDYFDEEDLAQQYNLHQEANKIDIAALTDEIVLSADQASTIGEAARVELAISSLKTSMLPGDLVRHPRTSLDASLTVAQEQALLGWLADELAGAADVDSTELERLRQRVGAILDNLPERLREHLERLLAATGIDLDSPGGVHEVAEHGVDEQDRAELEESLRRLVRTFRGAPRARRSVSGRGRVDGGRTMRASARFDGVPFRPVLVSKPHDRPRLLVLVDVSMSVRATAGFTLAVVHGLANLVAQVRTWAFVADVVETTEALTQRAAQGLGGPDTVGALAYGLPTAGLDIDLDADSDYGSVFATFLDEHGTALNRRSTLVVFGDARGNGHDPGLNAFEEMTRRVRETVWLTPEPSYSWHLGRCDLPAYAEHCSRVQVVRALADLDRLAARGPVAAR